LIRGYDVSHHQGVFDHERAVEEGFDFCIVKSTEGATFKDPVFDRSWRKLSELGITRGAYHFGRPGSNSARAEASFYLETVKLQPEDIRPILDLEDFGREALGPRALAEWVQEWVEEVVEATGKRAIIYTRQFWIEHLGQLTDNFDTDLWVPRYSDAMLDPQLPRAWDDYVLWQWAGSSGDDFFPHDITRAKNKLGPETRLTVAGRKVDQNVGNEGTTLGDLVGKPRAKKVERWVVSATWHENDEHHVRNLCEPTKLERLGKSVEECSDAIARHRRHGHHIRLTRVMVEPNGSDQ
jgi:Glycosyl hydrolases family 25